MKTADCTFGCVAPGTKGDGRLRDQAMSGAVSESLNPHTLAETRGWPAISPSGATSAISSVVSLNVGRRVGAGGGGMAQQPPNRRLRHGRVPHRPAGRVGSGPSHAALEGTRRWSLRTAVLP